jgi:osmotically-inducible protein OsmY
VRALLTEQESTMPKRFKFIVSVLAVLGLAGFLGRVVPTGPTVQAAEKAAEDGCLPADGGSDFWLDTRLETAYLFNPHLNNLTIDTEVENGNVMLTGTVRSDIDRDLAEEIARSLDGVKSVANSLEVRPDAEASHASETDIDFFQKVSDATTTAQVKTRLIMNGNIPAADIAVETENDVVRLSGTVGTDTERQLAEFIAKNTSGVASVTNEISLRQSG